MGLAYIFAWNFALFSIVIAWVFQGHYGVLELGSEFMKLIMQLHEQFYGSEGRK